MFGVPPLGGEVYAIGGKEDEKSSIRNGMFRGGLFTQAVEWKYTFEKPADDWYKAEFKDDAWKKGESPFGVSGTPNIEVKTEWRTKNIWMRRPFVLEPKKKFRVPC